MSKLNLLRGATQFAHLGATLAISVLLGFFGGYWVDTKLGTSPLFVLLGSFSGATGGFIYLIRQVTQKGEKVDEESKDAEKDK